MSLCVLNILFGLISLYLEFYFYCGEYDVEFNFKSFKAEFLGDSGNIFWTFLVVVAGIFGLVLFQTSNYMNKRRRDRDKNDK